MGEKMFVSVQQKHQKAATVCVSVFVCNPINTTMIKV